jgi:CheY-like chemotaxis protein
MARILVVDDDDVFKAILEDSLKERATKLYSSRWPLRITSVGDPITALSIVKEHNFELIITDILMAKMSGWEFIKELRKKFPQFSTPIVVISAIDAVELEYAAMKHGASAWFSKPLQHEKFSSEIFKLVQER